MLRITVELVPYGIEKNVRTLGVMTVWNEGPRSRTGVHYNYGYKIKETKPLTGIPVDIDGQITGYNRVNPVWLLISRILNRHFS